MADFSDTLQRLGEFADRISLGTGTLLKDMFGSRNRRVVRSLVPIVQRINELEPKVAAYSAAELKALTGEFRTQIDQGRSLDDLLPEAFAAVREAAKRTLSMRHFDVQMMGGIALHRGSIAEMSTGEGKTLVATAPAFLNALLRKGVFVITVNDYLARRDCEWMRPIFEALGMTLGAIQSTMSPGERHPAYAADVTYGTNNEFGFDYLRDNMKSRLDQQVQKNLYYAIVDEVDSILIDEARTPLIISGLPDRSSELYYKADQIARQLKAEVHFEVKEKEHQCILTEEGIERAQDLAGVDSFYTGSNMEWPHHIETALRAHHLYQRDKSYVVKEDDDGQPGVIIVDEFTGRLMPGRRWSDGLHQAVEAKEGVRIREEHQTLATITFQNYFRLYEKLAGMTGTAMTEAAEFQKIYELDVVQIPTNKPNQRKDGQDVIYLDEDSKFAAIVREICEVHEAGRPVLVGTVSIEKSEKLAKMLADARWIAMWLARRADAAKGALDALVAKKRPDWLSEGDEKELRELLGKPAAIDPATARRFADLVLDKAPKDDLSWHLDQVARYAATTATLRRGLPHKVLNAKFHQMEAQIVAQAGSKGAITIATNMAGRGTDILLGGNPEARARAEIPADADDAVYQEALARHRVICAKEKEEVIAAGGLHIIGTERHEARRIDNQLRGRAARQGDPGSTRFYLSLEDDLMRIFARDWVKNMLTRLGMLEGQEIESPMVSRGIEKAQRRVEQRNFEIRKNVLEYDEVMDKQRRTIYALRQEILEGVDLKGRILEMAGSIVQRLMNTYLGEKRTDWEMPEFVHRLDQSFGVTIDAASFDALDRTQIEAKVNEQLRATYDHRESEVPAEQMRRLEQFLLLNVIDSKWKDHLHAMTQLREAIGLRSYAQIDPKNEYKREGFESFQRLVEAVEEDVTGMIFRIQVVREDERSKLDQRWGGGPPPAGGAPAPRPPIGIPGQGMSPPRPGMARPMAPAGAMPAGPAVPRQPTADELARLEAERKRREEAVRNVQMQRPVRQIKKEGTGPGRNEPCPCGSGQKYKKCCFPKYGG
jgi:preprotein translocase subunit SecA